MVGRGLATMVAAVVLVVLGSFASQASAATLQSLLPQVSAPSSLTFVPGRPPVSQTLGHLVVQSNLWNLSPSAHGTVTVQASQGAVSWAVHLSGLCPLLRGPRCPAPLDYINGYPDLAYGQSPYGGPDTATDPVLPARWGNGSDDLWLDTAYSVDTPSTPMDLEYDVWLTPQAANATSQGPRNGIELEVRLDQSFVLGALTRLRFHAEGAVCLPAVVDGVVRSWCWNVLYGPSDSADMDLVIFIPQRLERQAHIAVNLTSIVAYLSTHSQALHL